MGRNHRTALAEQEIDSELPDTGRFGSPAAISGQYNEAAVDRVERVAYDNIELSHTDIFEFA